MVERRYDILVFPYLFARKIERKDGLLYVYTADSATVVHWDTILFFHPLSACRVTLPKAGAKYPKLPHKNKQENVSFLKKTELFYGNRHQSGVWHNCGGGGGGITPLPPSSLTITIVVAVQFRLRRRLQLINAERRNFLFPFSDLNKNRSIPDARKREFFWCFCHTFCTVPKYMHLGNYSN